MNTRIDATKAHANGYATAGDRLPAVRQARTFARLPMAGTGGDKIWGSSAGNATPSHDRPRSFTDGDFATLEELYAEHRTAEASRPRSH
jgi:hypothetical protein